jgi:hypothetical protein
MSDPMVPGFEAVGDEELFLVVHDGQTFEGSRNGGARATRGEGEATP